MPAHGTPPNRLSELARSVLDVSRSPFDDHEVATVLESMGWTDEAASRVFGASDLFELARQLWPVVKEGVLFEAIESPAEGQLLKEWLTSLRNFLRGVMFAAPMVMSVAAMLTLRFSLWSYLYFSTEVATAIALGTIGSFAVTGGFTQAIARRSLMYVAQSEYTMARRMTFALIRIGVLTAIIIGLLLLLIDIVFPVLPVRMLTIMIVYYSFLCGIWLSLTVFYMLQRELVFSGLVAFGIAIVYLLHEVLQVSIIPSQVIALSTVAMCSMVLAVWFFVREERHRPTAETPQMPRPSIVAYTVIPYFGYGFAYFVFLFVDRVLAWSSHDVFMPYVVWFRGEYELGMDYAMVSLVLPLGIVENVIRRFCESLPRVQKGFSADMSAAFNAMYKRIYTRSLKSYAMMSCLNGLLVFAVGTQIFEKGWLSGVFFMSNDTMFVFRWAVLGYSILAASLMNVLMLFSLSIPDPALGAVACALVADIVVGFVLSRVMHHTHAVFGFVVGSIVFAVLTTRAVQRIMSELDFYLYAAS
jgi:hypothetical protein